MVAQGTCPTLPYMAQPYRLEGFFESYQPRKNKQTAPKLIGEEVKLAEELRRESEKIDRLIAKRAI
jgi:hypothetical protein